MDAGADVGVCWCVLRRDEIVSNWAKVVEALIISKVCLQRIV
jgi:hypothetical protein